MMIIKGLFSGFIGIFNLIFETLSNVVDLENITKTALANGEDPIYGYFMLGLFSLMIFFTLIYVVAHFSVAFAKYVYVNEMQWRKLQSKRNARMSYIETSKGFEHVF